MHETTRLPLGSDVQDDASHPASAARFLKAEVAMRDLLRDATQQDWHLFHTGGNCTQLFLQGEGEAWCIVDDDASAPLSPGHPVVLMHLPGYRGHEHDYNHDQCTDLCGDTFANVILECARIAEQGWRR